MSTLGLDFIQSKDKFMAISYDMKKLLKIGYLPAYP
jgi:hypothetical protein